MGLGAQLTMWPVDLCHELVARGYRVIRFDNRDVGLSTKFDAAGMPDMAAIVGALVSGQPAIGSEERRVGKVCGSTCRSRGSAYRSKLQPVISILCASDSQKM